VKIQLVIIRLVIKRGRMSFNIKINVCDNKMYLVFCILLIIIIKTQ
jgi:hypothetical protein